MLRSSFALLALWAVFPGTGLAQVFKYLAYGDSITEGFNDNPACLGCANPLICGYPSRLSSALSSNCTNCSVVNHGLSFEKTINGITRLNNVVFAGDPTWDLMVLMEGSNDLFASTPVPEEMIRDNLEQMAHDAAELGIETLHASIIWFHPLANWGTSRDDEIEDLRELISVMSIAENRKFADVWNLLCPDGNDIHGHPHTTSGNGCFSQHYCEDAPGNPSDPWVIGHPGPSGFDMISDFFEASIIAVPVPGIPTLTVPSGDICDVAPTLTWTKESPDRASWYQVQVETVAGATVFEGWFPEADISAINLDPLIPGICSGTTCSVSLPASLTPGGYVWRVRGRNPNGRSAFTTDLAFEAFDGVPANATGLYPIANILNTMPTTPKYQWQESPGGTDYTLGDMIPATGTAGFTCSGGFCSVKPATPDLGLGSYTWTVTPSNICGSGTASAPVAFDVVACSNPGDLTLENETVTVTRNEDACGTVRAGDLGLGDFVVEGPNGDLTIHAGVAAELHNGFSVETGGRIVVIVDQ